MLEKEYKEHYIFQNLSKYAVFYKDLAFSIVPFLTRGINTIYNIDSYLYDSMQGTLESINDILIKGKINDSYALLRKYYDSAIINIYTNLYLYDNSSIENFVVEKIVNWIKGTEKLPKYRIMSKYIRDSKRLEEINRLLHKDKRYKLIRDRCNDHTHYNFYQYVLLNNNKVIIKNRIKYLDKFSEDLDNLFILHLSYMFYLNEHYMSSSDYMDSLEMGLEPEEGSQYFVAPFVQEVFDNVIKKNREDIANLIKNDTSMEL